MRKIIFFHPHTRLTVRVTMGSPTHKNVRRERMDGRNDAKNSPLEMAWPASSFPHLPSNRPTNLAIFLSSQSFTHTSLPIKRIPFGVSGSRECHRFCNPKTERKIFFFLSLSLSLSLPLSPSLSDRQVSTPKNGRGRKGVERAFLNLLTPILLLLLQKDFFPRFIFRENKRRVRLVDFFFTPLPSLPTPSGLRFEKTFRNEKEEARSSKIAYQT